MVSAGKLHSKGLRNIVQYTLYPKIKCYCYVRSKSSFNAAQLLFLHVLLENACLVKKQWHVIQHRIGQAVN